MLWISAKLARHDFPAVGQANHGRAPPGTVMQYWMYTS